MCACLCVYTCMSVTEVFPIFFFFLLFLDPLPDISFMVNWALKAGQLSVYLDHLLYSSSTLHFNNKPINQKMILSFSVPVPCRKKHCRDLDKMQRTMAALLRPTRGTDHAVWSRTCRSRKCHLKLCPLRKPWSRFENTRKCKLWSQNYFYLNHLSQNYFYFNHLSQNYFYFNHLSQNYFYFNHLSQNYFYFNHLSQTLAQMWTNLDSKLLHGFALT